MPSGWDEFLEKAKRQAASEEPGELHALWSEFLQRSQESPRASSLQLLAEVVKKAPIEQRASVAFVMASLLAPLELPAEVEQHRTTLARALLDLMDAVAPNKPESLVAHLVPKISGDPVLVGGGIMLSSALQLLPTCRRHELRVVAQLCNVGLDFLMRSLSAVLTRREGQPMDEALLQSKVRFDAALERYAQAARAFNAALGEVLFVRLDERLDIPET